MAFIETDITKLNENFIKIISEDWMLLAAGDEKKHNEMTVSWGGMGFLWNEPVATVYVRPQRYTDLFMQQKTNFSLCVFDNTYRDMLKKAGAISGKDIDKTQELRLSPLYNKDTVYFEQARLVLLCEKVYADKIEPQNFINADMSDKFYPNKDYHTLYIGTIKKVLIKA